VPSSLLQGITTVKGVSMKRGFSLATIAVLAWMSTSASLAQVAEQRIWPSISPTQWFWHESKTDLGPDQIVTVFRETTARGMTFLDPDFPDSILSAKRISLTTGKSKDKKKPSKVDGIRIDATWQGPEDTKPKEASSFIELESIQTMELWYLSNVPTDNWRVKMFADAPYTFVFGTEGFARRFMDSVASVLLQKALRLAFPKFGLVAENLTPEQAEALGKTMIESVLVKSVAIEGPADKAGITPLDVIVAVDGVKVRNTSHFSSIEASIASGSTVSVALLQRAEVPDSNPKQYVWNPKTVEMIAR
jgi:hypothetical protein